MDLAKVGEVCTIEVHGNCYNPCVPVIYVNERLATGWVLLSVKTMENPDRLSRELHPSVTTFVLGKPREKPNLGKRLDVDEDAIGAGAPCEGRNELPGK